MVDKRENIGEVPQTDQSKEKPIKLTRRDFLKITTLSTLGFLAKSLVPNEDGDTLAGKYLTEGLGAVISLSESQEASEIEKSIVNEAKEFGNPNHSPYLKILKEGISEFQTKNSKTPVVWQKSDQYLSDYDSFGVMVKPIEKDELFEGREEYEGSIPLQLLIDVAKGGDPTVAYSIFFNRLPKETQDAINTANANMTALPGTELYMKFYPKDGGNVFSHKDVSNYYEKIKKDLEVVYNDQKEKELLPTSKLLAYFLEKNEGKLKPSLGDLAGFMKYMIRGDNTEQAEVQIGWLREYVQDQINKSFSLNNVPSPDNLPSNVKDVVSSVWGLQYHAPHLIYLLSDLSPQVVRAAGIYEYVSHDHVAEAYKVKVDVELMNKLNDIIAYLQTFS